MNQTSIDELINQAVKGFDDNYDNIVELAPEAYPIIWGLSREDAPVIMSAMENEHTEYFKFIIEKDLNTPDTYVISASYMPILNFFHNYRLQ